MDILFKTDDWVFSYRVAGICVQNGKVLLQTTTGEDRSFAFPGGHVEFGETNEETLAREFKEEIGAEVRVGDLKWVAEVFFPWGSKPCHQICLYYMVDILNQDFPDMMRNLQQLRTDIYTLLHILLLLHFRLRL